MDNNPIQLGKLLFTTDKEMNWCRPFLFRKIFRERDNLLLRRKEKGVKYHLSFSANADMEKTIQVGYSSSKKSHYQRNTVLFFI
mmetsp:Transcript_41580/g.47260  ORF Transcript_41580/g.47260 Transcript_41580/m.47260 type:complete len:84 (+) Transcript_41580:151-402(+)